MLGALERQGRFRGRGSRSAMNLQHLPPALVRSGRVELWLEMKLPDAEARKRILENHLCGITAELSNCDLARVISTTEGFTGADIKRLLEDATRLYAFGRASGAEVRNATQD